MSLVTATEVRTAAKTSKVGILLQSDTDLDNMITLCQTDLESRTGAKFEETEVEEKVIGHKSPLIQLKYWPVNSVDELLINGSEYTLDDEEVEESTGSIRLSSPPYSATFMYEVSYTTSEPEDVDLAKDVLCTMVLDKIKGRESTVEEGIRKLVKTYIGAI